MRVFDEQIVDHLNKECNGEPVHFVGLGAFDFQVAFGKLRRIQTKEKARFFLCGMTYEWEEGPTDIPVWLLIGQVPKRFELPSPLALRMCLESGDQVDFFTAEGLYESAIVDFGPSGGGVVMDIF